MTLGDFHKSITASEPPATCYARYNTATRSLWTSSYERQQQSALMCRHAVGNQI